MRPVRLMPAFLLVAASVWLASTFQRSLSPNRPGLLWVRNRRGRDGWFRRFRHRDELRKLDLGSHVNHG
jgi:hypothetical protein